MKHRSLAILLAMLVGFQALFGGVSGGVVLCLGGGHQHEPAEVSTACQLACEHAKGWPGPVPTGEHGEDCSCVDIELDLVELVSLPKTDAGAGQTDLVQPTPAWAGSELGHGLSWTGPPTQPPWFDPGGAQRLAIVSSTQLIL